MKSGSPLNKFLASLLQPSEEGQLTAFPWPARKTLSFWWWLQQVASGVLLTLGLVLLVSQVIRVSQGPSDFCQDYIAAQRLTQGIPPYLPLRLWPNYVSCQLPMAYDAHPPFTILLFLPFGVLPKVPAFLAWGFCSLAAYLVSGLLLLRELGWCSLRGLAVFVGCSLLWEPFLGAETEQNLGQVLTLLLVLAWVLERRHLNRWAGGLLGLAGLIKLWPGMLVLFALLRRRWREGTIGGLILLLGTVATLWVLGLSAYTTYLGPAQADERLTVPTIGNLSLVGAVARILSRSTDPTYPWVAPPWALRLGDAVLVGELVAGLVLLGALAFLWHCRLRLQSEAGALLGQGLLITVLLITFPLTWHWGLITLLLPLAMTLLATRHLPTPPRWWYALLFLSLALLVRPLSLQTLISWLLSQQHGELRWWETPLLGLPISGVFLLAWVEGQLLWWVSP